MGKQNNIVHINRWQEAGVYFPMIFRATFCPLCDLADFLIDRRCEFVGRLNSEAFLLFNGPELTVLAEGTSKLTYVLLYSSRSKMKLRKDIHYSIKYNYLLEFPHQLTAFACFNNQPLKLKQPRTPWKRWVIDQLSFSMKSFRCIRSWNLASPLSFWISLITVKMRIFLTRPHFSHSLLSI